MFELNCLFVVCLFFMSVHLFSTCCHPHPVPMTTKFCFLCFLSSPLSLFIICVCFLYIWCVFYRWAVQSCQVVRFLKFTSMDVRTQLPHRKSLCSASQFSGPHTHWLSVIFLDFVKFCDIFNIHLWRYDSMANKFSRINTAQKLNLSGWILCRLL